MKSLTVRLKVVVSSAPVAARLRKFLTLSGATSGIIAISMAPISVSSVTHWPDIFSTVAPSKGSLTSGMAAAVRALAFFGPSGDTATLGGSWPLVMPASRKASRHEPTATSGSRRARECLDGMAENMILVLCTNDQMKNDFADDFHLALSNPLSPAPAVCTCLLASRVLSRPSQSRETLPAPYSQFLRTHVRQQSRQRFPPLLALLPHHRGGQWFEWQYRNQGYWHSPCTTPHQRRSRVYQ